MNRILIAVLVVLSFVSFSTAIKCYKCYSFNSTDTRNKCNSPFNSGGIETVECTGSCFKTTINQNKNITERGCKTQKHDDGCRSDGDATFTKIAECHCSADLCNAAGPSDLASGIFVGLIALVLRI